MIQLEITPLKAIAFYQWAEDFKKQIIRAKGSDPVSKAKAIDSVEDIANQISTQILKETRVGEFKNSSAEAFYNHSSTNVPKP